MSRNPFHSSTRLLACVAAALAFARPASAQETRVFTNGVAGTTMFSFSGAALPISDDVVRAMIAAHVPDALDPSSDARAVVLVLDANNEFVSGKMQKATIVTPGTDSAGGMRTFTVGDSAETGKVTVMMKRDNNGVVSVSPNGAASVVMMSHTSDGGPDGVFGSGYPSSDVASMAMKRYTAGQLASGPLVVTIVKLK